MSKRPVRRIQIKSDRPIEIPRKWKNEEMETLLQCIMQYGHKNLDKISESLPGRSIENIKTFIRTIHDTAGKLQEKSDIFEPWINQCKKTGKAPWRDCIQIARVLKYLSVDGLLESHPLPERCEGVDFSQAYRLVYQAMMGYPIQPVNQATADFVIETVAELNGEIKKQTDIIKRVEAFLKQDHTEEPTVANKPETPNPQVGLSSGSKKPLRVYERKRQPVLNPAIEPSLKIFVQEIPKTNPSALGSSKDFSVAIEGSDTNLQTTVNVPVAYEKDASNEIPPIVLCYNGKSIKIHEDLVVNGLSAISIKHHKGNCNEERRSSDDSSETKSKQAKDLRETKDNEGSTKRIAGLHYREFSKTTSDVPACLKDKMKRRNSFWNVHRPELSKLTWPENFVSSAVLQDFFHNHLRIHGTFCEPLHEFATRSSQMDEEFRNYSKLREIVPPRVLPPDEKVINIMEKSRSVQLNDEDLDPETMVHKSRAEFCVTIGEYIKRPPLKRTTSQQIPKSYVQPASRFESLPVQHEGLLSKEAMASEEKVFTVIGSTDFFLSATAKNSSKKLNVGNLSGILLRSASVNESQQLAATPPPSLNNFSQQFQDEGAEESGDPARVRTILSPRDETAEESGSQ